MTNCEGLTWDEWRHAADAQSGDSEAVADWKAGVDPTEYRYAEVMPVNQTCIQTSKGTLCASAEWMPLVQSIRQIVGNGGSILSVSGLAKITKTPFLLVPFHNQKGLLQWRLLLSSAQQWSGAPGDSGTYSNYSDPLAAVLRG
tara:strand:+ start:1467 stop:1895 length:429 start_codon:yes stop_codon:yes gene_type:complete